jgi:hypothetical protein
VNFHSCDALPDISKTSVDVVRCTACGLFWRRDFLRWVPITGFRAWRMRRTVSRGQVQK